MRAVICLCAAAVALVPRPAEAAPRADVVVLWAPGHDPAPIAEAARASGAALIDRTPAPTADAEAALAAALRRGIDAYDGLRVGEAWAALTEATRLADAGGGAGLTPAALSDLFLYRGLTQIQRGDEAAAWDELVTAATVAPIRVLDPARFGPRVVAEIERARAAALARPQVTLALDAPAGCAIVVDGVERVGPGGPVAVLAGPHWVHARCADGGRWGARVEARTAATTIAVTPVAPGPPADDELLIQARAAGARGLAIVAIGGDLATVRLLAIDGRERDRRTLASAGGEAAIAGALTELLRAEPPRRWYRSRWAWAAGAALLAAGIAIPITAALASDGAPATVTVRGPGTLP